MKKELSIVILNIDVMVLCASLWWIVQDVLYPSIQNTDGTLNITSIFIVCAFISIWILVILINCSIITRLYRETSFDISSPLVTGEILEKNGFEKLDSLSYFLKHEETDGDFVKIWITLGSEKFPACEIKIQRSRKEYPEISDVRFEADLEFDWIIDVSDLISILRVYKLEKEIN